MQEPTPPSAPETEPHPESADGRHLRRMLREHPALTVLGVAGAGLFGGIELAAGVLLGVGVAALIRKPKNGQEPHEAHGRAGRMVGRAPHGVLARARAVVQAVRGKNIPPEEHEHAPAPAADTRASDAPFR